MSTLFNIVKGREAHYGSLPATNDAFIVIALDLAGLETDANLRDLDTVAAVLATTTNEHASIGRQTITAVTVTVDDANDRVQVSFDAAVAYTAPDGDAVGALLVAYDPDTTGGTDADLIPFGKYDVTWDPDTNDTNVTFDYLVRCS